jgi:hypothetical protein
LSSIRLIKIMGASISEYMISRQKLCTLTYSSVSSHPLRSWFNFLQVSSLPDLDGNNKLRQDTMLRALKEELQSPGLTHNLSNIGIIEHELIKLEEVEFILIGGQAAGKRDHPHPTLGCCVSGLAGDEDLLAWVLVDVFEIEREVEVLEGLDLLGGVDELKFVAVGGFHCGGFGGLLEVKG